jgi:hypothetical protein
MNFRKTAIALTAAGALAAGSMTVTQPAHALAEWVIPAIIVAGVGGVALGVAADNARADGVVSVRPTGPCWVENRRRGPVEVCPR